jgi:hypothetical protein
MKPIEITETKDKRTNSLEKYSPDKIFRMIQTNASDAYLAAKSGRPIFRGMRNLSIPVFLVTPRNKTRVSANTTNHYNLLFSNLPSWKDLPPRNKSLICTTNLYTAKEFGPQTYLVFPLDGAHLGVCPAEDLWRTKIEEMNVYLEAFNDWMSWSNVSVKSYDTLLQSFLLHTDTLSEPDSDLLISNSFLKKVKKCKTKEDVIRLLDTALDPSDNGITPITSQEIDKIPFDREVWTDSKSYMVHIGSDFCQTYFQDILDNI